MVLACAGVLIAGCGTGFFSRTRTPADPSTFAADVPNWFDAMTEVHKLPHL
jgi:hypothetical protein